MAKPKEVQAQMLNIENLTIEQLIELQSKLAEQKEAKQMEALKVAGIEISEELSKFAETLLNVQPEEIETELCNISELLRNKAMFLNMKELAKGLKNPNAAKEREEREYKTFVEVSAKGEEPTKTQKAIAENIISRTKAYNEAIEEGKEPTEAQTHAFNLFTSLEES